MKSVRVYHLDTSTITHILQDVVAELASQKLSKYWKAQKIQEIKARFGTSAAEEMNTVLQIWRRRVHKFFSQPALCLLRFLNPVENQNSWSREEREALLELLVTCIHHYCVIVIMCCYITGI